MQVILLERVAKLGQMGEVVEVKPGYARNFLLPLGYAVPVTKANMDSLERDREAALAEEAGRVQSLRDMATQLQESSVTIEGRANEEGHLFGSVTASQIAAALHEKGFDLDERQVRLEHPLKEIGVYDVALHLHNDVNSTIKVWVVQAKPE